MFILIFALISYVVFCWVSFLEHHYPYKYIIIIKLMCVSFTSKSYLELFQNNCRFPNDSEFTIGKWTKKNSRVNEIVFCWLPGEALASFALNWWWCFVYTNQSKMNNIEVNIWRKKKWNHNIAATVTITCVYNQKYDSLRGNSWDFFQMF